jgi:hypothetical protein
VEERKGSRSKKNVRKGRSGEEKGPERGNKNERSDEINEGKSRQGKAGQVKTGQDKTRQDKTGQDSSLTYALIRVVVRVVLSVHRHRSEDLEGMTFQPVCGVVWFGVIL